VACVNCKSCLKCNCDEYVHNIDCGDPLYMELWTHRVEPFAIWYRLSMIKHTLAAFNDMRSF